MTYYDQVEEAADTVRARVATVPDLAIVLGSGLGDFAGTLGDAVSMPYGELPHWPASRIVGHEGRLVVGSCGGRTIAALAGRCHAYEGHDLRTVTFGVRALGLLGVRTLVLTNAAGGINTSFTQGGLMLIDDHINLLGNNPLVGENDERFGPRFPDMTAVYSRRLRDVAESAAVAAGVGLSHGVRGAARPELRNAGRDPVPADDRRRRRRHVDRARSDCRASHGDGSARHLLHHEHGSRRAAAAARSCRGHGDRPPRARAVHRAAEGDSGAGVDRAEGLERREGLEWLEGQVGQVGREGQEG